MDFVSAIKMRHVSVLLLVLLAVIVGMTTQVVLAQSPTCFIPILESQTSNTFGFSRTVERKIGVRIDPDCLQEDGRLNHADAAAGVIVYCLPDAGVAIYDVDTLSRGDLALALSSTDIAAVPETPIENTLIDASANGAIRLYRLTSSELQVNSPGIYPSDPEYVFIWNGCQP